MSKSDGIFSVRLVIADFYMEKPASGLDPCYSEFRGKEIKRVPIVRVFGSNAQGQKTCMHVHGVFPYFYVPYEGKEFESLDKAVYQIALHLDKAINISLGQGSSTAQHVFKVQPVKGIPFYGYHRSEHQFLKIYLFNPRFVRRAANILQNGAVMGKTFHPLESHVPYILQFMIDYNLYGMSMLHVPHEVVKYRRKNDDDEIVISGVHSGQMLDVGLVKKQSICALEVDIASNFILNRFQLLANAEGTHANPGIEAIWQDERLRRQKMAASVVGDDGKVKAIPALEVAPSQERPNAKPTESDLSHRSRLLTKLLTMENSLSGGGDGSAADQSSLNTTTILQADEMTSASISGNASVGAARDKKRPFNLKQFFVNAVYPEECSQDQQLADASAIGNHLSNNNIFQQSLVGGSRAEAADRNRSVSGAIDEAEFADETIIDEELVLSLSQPNVPMNATLRAEDMELLDVLQQLEEENEEKQNVDLDSTLAPLSQPDKAEFTPELLDKETLAAASNDPGSDDDSDGQEGDGHLIDFSMALDDIDELLLRLTQSQTGETTSSTVERLPQVDGSDDVPRTPTKSSRASKRQETSPAPPTTPTTSAALSSPRRSPRSLLRSPRTPQSRRTLRYRPLPMTAINRQVNTNVQTHDEATPLSRPQRANAASSSGSLRKQVAVTGMRRRSIAVANAQREEAAESSSSSPVTLANAPKNSSRRSTRRTINLDKTHITCALTPRRKSERLLKVYNVADKKKNVEIPEDEEGETDERAERNEPRASKRDQKKVPAEPKRRSIRQKPATECNENDDEMPAKAIDEESTQEPIKVAADVASPTRESPTQDVGEIDEEIVASDHELEESYGHRRKTPNLRRLQRSFRHSIAERTRRTQTKEEESNETSPVGEEPSMESHDMRVNNQDDPKTPSLKGTPEHKDTSGGAEDNDDDDDDISIRSFYDMTMVESPSVFSELSSPVLFGNHHFESSKSGTPSAGIPASPLIKLSTAISSGGGDVDDVILTPLQAPPTYEEVAEGCRKFQIHEFDFTRPHYSNPDDVTKAKEVGFTVLHVPGNKLNDLPEFESVLGEELQGLSQWRRRKWSAIGGPYVETRYRGVQHMREFFATNKRVIIAPLEQPPTNQEAKLWLKAKEMMRKRGGGEDVVEEAAHCRIDEDSPIKVRRQKVTMMMAIDESEGAGGDSGEDMDCSTRSLTLTPLTPGTPILKTGVAEPNESHTPLTSVTVDHAMSRGSSSKRHRRFPRRAKLSLSRRLGEIAFEEAKSPETKKLRFLVDSDDGSSTSGGGGRGIERGDGDSGDCELKSSQNSFSSDSTVVSSQTALAAMERSSFARDVMSPSAGSGSHEVSFGLDSASLNNTFGFKVNLENLQQAKADIECNNLTIISLEVFAPTRGDLCPDPAIDAIRCIFYAIENSLPGGKGEVNGDAEEEDAKTQTQMLLPAKACGYIIVHDGTDAMPHEGRVHGIDADVEVQVVGHEMEAVQALLELCHRWDPDIYAGYEIEMASWGYVIERAKFLCMNIVQLLSRVPSQRVGDFVDEDREHFTDLDIEMKICGRILLNVWRLMRSEIALTSYTFENVVYHILHKRCPWHSHRDLTQWFASPHSRWIVLEYHLERVRGTLTLLDQLDLLGRTSEMAKLIGIQFYEVLSRGSQFRVESMMLRMAKPKNLVPLSPSVQQRAHMRAPEYLPLILEPQSRFYADPVIVLDFQSLYPSMIIAYNYCFSTCLGRVEHLGQSTPFEFGASQLRVSPAMLREYFDRDLITISPCGAVFVKREVREGILPRMLTEILDTRLMVKQSMKLHKSNSALQRVLHSRQLGLKLMANVTYGYTAANFSGRMPAVEVGDSVVAKGRETLERAIRLVQTNERWNVSVVYGDTDSLFVLVPGRSREQAFKIGEEIVEAVTKDNPQPVKLKLEKVYQPCILQTKKRYVGYMYETADQSEPVYEAKGIETVRRDGCPAVAKMLEKVLRILFESADVSQVKRYVCRQFTKLLAGRANLQDLIFAKEFRGLSGYKPKACVPALELTRKWLQTDPRRIPRCGERVPFIIINGPPGVPLIRLVRHPHEVLANEGYKINAIYYITKAIIPPLNRCLLLIGADVNEWFTSLPRKILLTPALSTGSELIVGNWAKQQQQQQPTKSTISQYFSNTNCIVGCGRQTKEGVCSHCQRDPTRSVITIQTRIANLECGYHQTQNICQACCGRVGDLNCGSLDCPVLYVLDQRRRDLRQIEHLRKLLERF